MDSFSEKLKNFEEGKFAFLRLYSVTLDRELALCELTFLYPQSIEKIDEQTRKEVLEFAQNNLSLKAKIKVKFKKSFLDERLIGGKVLSFFETNFRSLYSQLSPQQVEVKVSDENVKIIFHAGKMFCDGLTLSVKKALHGGLESEFIANFEIEAVQDERFEVADEMPFVPIKVEKGETKRYKVTIIKKLFGDRLVPYPELIKFATEPREEVLLFGKISNVKKKSFTIKNGKRAGEEKTYFTFMLDDGNQIECIYFCPKSNEKKCEALQDGLNFLCLGKLKEGLSGNITYYISAMALAQTNESLSELNKPQIKQVEEKNVVLVEDFADHSQENFFVKNPVYKEPIASSNIVVYDLETTGLNPESDQIIEIGAIKIEKGKITKKFASFVKPTIEIPIEATRKNHITNEMVASAPKIEDVIADFYKFCEGCIISGYNNTDFDNKFLRKAGQAVGITFTNQNIDVFLLARMSKLKTTNFKLTSVAAALGIDLKDAHRAYNDAFATAKVLLKLNEA